MASQRAEIPRNELPITVIGHLACEWFCDRFADQIAIHAIGDLDGVEPNPNGTSLISTNLLIRWRVKVKDCGRRHHHGLNGYARRTDSDR